jgi:hypothetical protein
VKGGPTPISKPSILRIKTVEKYSVLICEVKCAGTIEVNVAQCAPCHLPDLDPRLDPQWFFMDSHKECVVYEQSTAWADMMLCDKCNRGWHTFCLNPTVSRNIEVVLCPMRMPADRTGKVPQGLPVPESTAPVLRSILKKGKQSAGGIRSLAEPIKEPSTPARRSGRRGLA